jgi:uncharacterized protein YcbK (DUF882 family)
LGGAAYLGGVLPGSVLASVTQQSVPPRALSFLNTHTAETLELVYFERGEYLADALQAINRLLRDHRTHEIKAIDVHLLDLLFAITEKLDTKKPLQVVSGFRSPRSNAQLRRSGRGVARKSYHMTGQAIDIRIPDTSLRSLRQIAVGLKSGGVGYYPRSGFVHVDTGPIRTW